MAVLLEPRRSLAGAELQLLVVAAGRGACIGVDMSSGGFVVARWAGRSAPALKAYDVAAARVVDHDSEDPLGRREALCVERPPHAVGRVRRRVAERYLRPLQLPERQHPLGFPGPTVPFWMLAEASESSDRSPSVCLVAPPGPVAVVRPAVGLGLACRFTWRGVTQELPLADGALSLLPVMNRTGRMALSGAPLAELLGFVPRRALVALSAPRSGTCHKVVPGLLP